MKQEYTTEPRPVPEAHKKKILDMWPNHSTKEIAAACGIGHNTVRRYATELRKMGYDLPSKQGGRGDRCYGPKIKIVNPNPLLARKW